MSRARRGLEVRHLEKAPTGREEAALGAARRTVFIGVCTDDWIAQRLPRRAAKQLLPAYGPIRCRCGRKSGRGSRDAALGPADDLTSVSGGSHRLRQRCRAIGHLRVSALGGTSHGNDPGSLAARAAVIGPLIGLFTIAAAICRETLRFAGAYMISKRSMEVRCQRGSRLELEMRDLKSGATVGPITTPTTNRRVKRCAGTSHGIGQECPAWREGSCGKSGPVLRVPSRQIARSKPQIVALLLGPRR